MDLRFQLMNYLPFNEQEEMDKAFILSCLDREPDVYLRENWLCHLTASAWIVNADRTKALMAFHNVYQSWAWLGGHADGERDLLEVALREAREESGLEEIRPVLDEIFSVEVLTVDGHVKRGKYVSSHLHLNVTYLLEADDQAKLAVKEGENTAVSWFPLDEAVNASTEKWFRDHVYRKLNQKLRMSFATK